MESKKTLPRHKDVKSLGVHHTTECHEPPVPVRSQGLVLLAHADGERRGPMRMQADCALLLNASTSETLCVSSTKHIKQQEMLCLRTARRLCA